VTDHARPPCGESYLAGVDHTSRSRTAAIGQTHDAFRAARLFASPSPHQKLVILTEHRDTLHYLEQRITTLLGRTKPW